VTLVAVPGEAAADAPDRVRSLTLIEPPPVLTPSATAFRNADDDLVRTRREQATAAALDAFLSQVVGPDRDEVTDALVPGSSAQMRRDTTTFFDTDLPALLDRCFGPADVRRITCPVLHVGGTDSGPWFAEVRELILDWFPDADDVVIAGADHALAMTHASEIAEALDLFLRRHQVDEACCALRSKLVGAPIEHRTQDPPRPRVVLQLAVAAADRRTCGQPERRVAAKGVSRATDTALPRREPTNLRHGLRRSDQMVPYRRRPEARFAIRTARKPCW